jgi:lipopolysaccharide transport system permease protein
VRLTWATFGMLFNRRHPTTIARRSKTSESCTSNSTIDGVCVTTLATSFLPPLYHHRWLFLHLLQREIKVRYQGSALGMLWALLTPLLMLLIYTFVFSVVFTSRWRDTDSSPVTFVLLLLPGLLTFNLLAECFSRAPSLIVSNPTYVKKVVFPIELLPIISLGSSLFHFVIGLAVWLLAHLIAVGMPPISALLLPVVLLPFLLFICGISWFLASVGVYLRDISQVTGLAVQALMFLSPIFYPISAVPEAFRFLMYCNPLTVSIEMIRGVLYWGQAPQLATLVLTYAIGISVASLGFSWFQRTRSGFADVL